MWIQTVALLAFLANLGQCAQILVVNPMPSYSHFIIPFELSKELARRGHEVTAITSYPQRNKIKGYTDIPVVENIPLMEEEKQKLFARQSKGIIDNLTSLFDMMAAITNNTLHHRNVKKLLESNQKFDIVLIEHFFNEALTVFGKIFDAPIVLVSSQSASAMNNYIFANPSPTSYVGGSTTSSKKMDFWQRLQNFLMTKVFEVALHIYSLPQQKEIFKSVLPDSELDDVLYNTSLMLTNSHVSVSSAVPHVPAIVQVGGLHINPRGLLPDDMKQFLDGAKEGVVLFSMGSNLRSDDLKDETKRAILKAFSKIKERVLWKFETDLADVPDNVKISFWVPQQDVLAHPNVKAFITHGGRLSTEEAVYFGVPIVGIPVFGDQIGNVAHAVADGYAVRVDLEGLTEEEFSRALNEVLTNKKYRENAQYRSRLMRDQPLKPMDSAIFWVEHVIRHKGAPHLRSAGLDLEWYQRELIDVIGFLGLVAGILVLVIYLAIKKMLNFVFEKKVLKKRVISKTKKKE